MKSCQRCGRVKSMCKGPGAEEFSQRDWSISVKGRVA